MAMNRTSVRTPSFLWIVSLLVVLTWLPAAGASELESPLASAQGLLQRILPGRASGFVVEIIPAAGSNDVFEIESRGEKIVLRGNSAGSIASALNHYLKQFCQCELSWCGDQLNVPTPLPPSSPSW